MKQILINTLYKSFQLSHNGCSLWFDWSPHSYSLCVSFFQNEKNLEGIDYKDRLFFERDSEDKVKQQYYDLLDYTNSFVQLEDNWNKDLTKIYECLQKLLNTSIKIKNDGHDLFIMWNPQVYCATIKYYEDGWSKKKEPTIKMEYYLSTDSITEFEESINEFVNSI